MTYKRLIVPLPEPEFVALQELAKRELRKPGDQARHILRLILAGEQSNPLGTKEKSVAQACTGRDALVSINP